MNKSQQRTNCLLTPVHGLSCYDPLINDLNAHRVCSAYGMDDSQRAHFLSALARDTGRGMIILVPNDQAAMRMREDMDVLTGGRAKMLPPRDISFVRSAASSRDLAMRRVEVLGACVGGDADVLIVPVDAALHRLDRPEVFRENTIALDESAQMEPADLIEKLTRAGYERVQIVEARGQCALRGGIVDVYPVGEPNALRIEFFDDEIDSIRSFDVMTQRSVSRRTKIRIFPAKEFLLTDQQAREAADALKIQLQAAAENGKTGNRQKQLEAQFGLSPFADFLKAAEEEAPDAPKKRENPGSAHDRAFAAIIDALETGRYFDCADSLLPVLLNFNTTIFEYFDDPIIVFDQPERLRERCDNRIAEFREMLAAALEHGDALPSQGELLFGYDQLIARADGRRVMTVNSFLRADADFKPEALYQIEGRNATAYQSNIRELAIDIEKWQKENWQIALLAGGSARAARLLQALQNQNCTGLICEDSPNELTAGEVLIFPFTVNRGFLYPELRLAVVAESDIYGVNRQKSRTRARSGEKISAFTELKIGDYVVHENHGVGQFMGVVRLSSDGTYRDFLHIRYQGTDKLYVPTDQLDRVQKYIGSEGEAPKLNRLSGGEWQRQKSKVRQSIKDIAGDLLKLYAQREAVPGYAFEPDTPWQREFEDNFPYEETPDQLAAIEDIKRDMERPRVMDRLLCGDVGYGKTEVALRAIFKAVMSGKQAAMLAPTTILVQQHYATMLNRFAGFPVHVEVLSRFKTAAEQKKILQDLKEGSIDVIVGTHRLLAKDVEFKDLGLLVVDEEQRFGVTHKEAIKRLKQSIDVLTLTATPIPRTLHMSMVGIRDMSLLQSPPEERYPVQTYVVEYSDGLVRDAIMRELGRGGQVYVLYNRVQTIEVMYARLKRLVPEARIAVGHGQMREHALEDVMLDFYEGKFDVLLCTTIIEAGLDVQRANTLIVCNADQFGLSQLYQLRGRVGRSNRLAYAYLTVSPNKVLTETADKRLNAIREFTEFGSGFRVAMRDLEIRGAGNLLGSQQSGFMASVGYDMYVKMIEDAVREMRGDTSMGDVETRVDVKVDAYLPQEYVSNDMLRVEMYKKIASIRSQDSRDDLIEELIDRFGDPNRPVMNLIEIASLKALCERIGIDYVTSRGFDLMMRFSISADIDLVRVLEAIRKYPDDLHMLGGNPPTLVYTKKNAAPEELLRGAVDVMQKVIADFEGGQPKEA